MKKIINYSIIGLMGFCFVLGFVAASFACVSYCDKTKVATYDKSGKTIVSYSVSEENREYQVESYERELISNIEYNRRTAKNLKIQRDKAKEKYDVAKDDVTIAGATKNSLQSAYETANASYKIALAALRSTQRAAFISTINAFANPYLMIIALLGIALLINQKIDYKPFTRKEKQDE